MFKPVHVHGWLARSDKASSRILYAGRRHGDVTAMATPMASNLKLLSDASSESIDAMMYRQMSGSLMYLMNMRSDICFAMNSLSQFLTDLRHVHLIATKHILRYLKGIS